MKKFLIPLVAVLLIILVYFAFKYYKTGKINLPQRTSITTKASATPSSTSTSAEALAEPIAQFKERITKKPFGIYITPQNSPIQPERFTGFHTGADVEEQDVTTDVPVYALADGTIVLARTVSGYGGVLMLDFNLDGQEHTALYGHIRLSSLPAVGQLVHKGEQVGLLGTGYSEETDGERRHLHLAILSDNRLDIRGYVQNQNELSGWLDPLSLYK